MWTLLLVPIKRLIGRDHFYKLLVLAAFVILLPACSGSGTATAPALAPGDVAATIPANPPPAEPDAETPVSSTISFSQQVLPILQSRCIRCHGGEKTEEHLNMTSYDGLMAGSE